MRKSSLLALTKSNKNLGMKILQLERELSGDYNCNISCKWENDFSEKWKKEQLGSF